jgi:predicted protein tyrosine phosphatase
MGVQYTIMNRLNARQATYDKDAPLSAIISITDIGSEVNQFYPQSWLLDVLHIQFDDVTERMKGCITKKQANEIADFVLRMYSQIERFIVHCELGQSRSAGVVAAISVFYEGYSGGIYGNRAYKPNRTCHSFVLDALKRKSR